MSEWSQTVHLSASISLEQAVTSFPQRCLDVQASIWIKTVWKREQKSVLLTPVPGTLETMMKHAKPMLLLAALRKETRIILTLDCCDMGGGMNSGSTSCRGNDNSGSGLQQQRCVQNWTLTPLTNPFSNSLVHSNNGHDRKPRKLSP